MVMKSVRSCFDLFVLQKFLTKLVHLLKALENDFLPVFVYEQCYEQCQTFFHQLMLLKTAY